MLRNAIFFSLLAARLALAHPHGDGHDDVTTTMSVPCETYPGTVIVDPPPYLPTYTPTPTPVPTPEVPEVPSDTPEAPSESDTPDVPSETTDVPSETTDVPSETTDAPSETPDVPVETPDVPVETPDVPEETPEVPDEPTEVPPGPEITTTPSPDGNATILPIANSTTLGNVTAPTGNITTSLSPPTQTAEVSPPPVTDGNGAGRLSSGFTSACIVVFVGALGFAL